MVQKAKRARWAGSLKIGIDELLGFAGFASFIVALYGLFFVLPGIAGSSEPRLSLQVIAAVILAAAFTVAHFAAFQLASPKGQMVIGCLIVVGLLAFGAATLLFQDRSLEVKAALVGFSALGLCGLGGAWFSFLCKQPPKMVCFDVSAGILASMASCFMASYLEVFMLRVVVVFGFALSALCLAALAKLRGASFMACTVTNADSDKRSSISATSAIMLAFVYFELGFAAGICDVLPLAPWFCAGSALAGCIMAIDAFCGQRINERSMLAPMVPITVAAFLAMFSFGSTVQTVAVVLLGAISTIFVVFGWTALACHVQLFKLSPFRVYAKARVFDCVTGGLGIACGYAMAVLFGGNAGAAVRGCIIIAIVYAAISSFCRKPRFPVSDAASVEEDAAQEGENTWLRRCRALAESCDLSERQMEVLILIAQGRNAKYIQGALTISLSTAQTHIRNIYRKAGVHSRQELLDLIEQTRLYGED